MLIKFCDIKSFYEQAKVNSESFSKNNTKNNNGKELVFSKEFLMDYFKKQREENILLVASFGEMFDMRIEKFFSRLSEENKALIKRIEKSNTNLLGKVQKSNETLLRKFFEKYENIPKTGKKK